MIQFIKDYVSKRNNSRNEKRQIARKVNETTDRRDGLFAEKPASTELTDVAGSEKAEAKSSPDAKVKATRKRNMDVKKLEKKVVEAFASRGRIDEMELVRVLKANCDGSSSGKTSTEDLIDAIMNVAVMKSEDGGKFYELKPEIARK